MKTTDQRTTISPYWSSVRLCGREDEEDVGEDAAEPERDGQARRRPPVGADSVERLAGRSPVPRSLRLAPPGSSIESRARAGPIRRGVRIRKRRIISIIRRPITIAASELPVAEEVPTRGR